MLQVPDHLHRRFPLANGVVLPIERVPVGVHLRGKGNLPNADYALGTTGEEKPLLLLVSLDCKERTRVAAQSNVRLDITIKFFVLLLNVFHVPHFDTTVFSNTA